MLVIDNYDSFTFNLVQYLQELGQTVTVLRNDPSRFDEAVAANPRSILISPGPGTPDEAGMSLRVIEHFCDKVPILGVCLGHQAIAQHFGARIVRAERLMHGRTSRIVHDGEGVFHSLPSPFTATRYHSFIVEESTVPETLTVVARTEEGEIMAVAHKTRPIYGVQFHPESFLSEHGHGLLRNFVELAESP